MLSGSVVLGILVSGRADVDNCTELTVQKCLAPRSVRRNAGECFQEFAYLSRR